MIEKEFLHFVLESETNLGKVISTGFKSDYLDFENPGFSSIRALFDVVINFYMKYGRIIDREHLLAYLVNSTFAEKEVKEILLTFEEVKHYSPSKDFNFIIDNLKQNYSKFILQRKLGIGIDLLIKNDVSKCLQTIKEGIFSVENVLQETSNEGTIQESALLRVKNFEDIKNGATKPGLSTGFSTFDKLTGGMKPGELIVVMSGPREGKSTFLLNVGYNVQMIQGKNVFFLSAENPRSQLERRYDSLHSGLPYSKIRDGTLSDSEEATFKKSIEEIIENKSIFYIWDQPICTPQMLSAKLSELEQTIKFDLIIVDYLSLIRPDKSSTSIWQDVGNVALGLREIARTRKVPVLTACQVSREGTKHQKIRYETYDIALSYLVIFHADTVLALRVLNPDILNTGLGICELNASIVKCRDGSQGEFTIDASFDIMKMQERNYIKV